VASRRSLDDEESVTAAKKLFLAAAIVAVGYGLAVLLGQPIPLLASQSNALAEAPPIPAPLRSSEISPTGSISGGARLIPDPQGQASSYVRIRESATHAGELFSESAAETEPASQAATAHAPRQFEDEFPQPFTPASDVQPIPRATLLNQAPRPLASETRASQTAREFENRQVETAPVRPSVPNDFMAAQFTSDVGPAGNRSNSDTISHARTISAGLSAAFAPLSPAPISAADKPRSHIVVDGDSLAKLAGRYLDDPHRAAEIFDLNRQVLRSPELLPIGAELAIPPRSAVVTGAEISPQSSMPRAVAIHAPAASGLVPIRPIPRTTSFPPRAFLAPPRPLE
jgi:nucleoid-associated protein YgaU